MTQIADRPSTRAAVRPLIPPLRNGDNMTRDEFIRRHDAMLEGTKAELIEGIAYLPLPANFGLHGNPHFNVTAMLGQYSLATPGVEGGDNASLFLDMDNLPQPDVFLMIARGYKGSATVNEKGYVVGAPELVIEIANTSADYDLHQKMNVYRRNGVAEYGVWRTLDGEFDLFRLSAGKYQRVEPHADRLIRSMALPGLWLNPTAIVALDWLAASADIRRGIESPEHLAFVENLRGRLGH
jgi:Uma2 family endonuclease